MMLPRPVGSPQPSGEQDSFVETRQRTNPYDAPYFFPHPGSPEADKYVQKIKASRMKRA
jgi:hypothetical protein